ncbi:lysyl-tRNA synthetase class 2 [Methylohalomonas lacus]|uniref:Lysine--tRNA ligase n=1 Tax=Methylohalomonas lacus TaxID=398773 RepID=A0AAE3HLM3_9GAMM|nr:lysine--tRNA ligase [Methylohalomonas lacus]MCS3904605.1 lysyl-tRNA synthetase class 2 [Methylohalomonas lacus]
MSENNENDLLAQRRAKLDSLREQGNAYPNDFKPDTTAAAILAEHENKSAEELEQAGIEVAVAGRMLTRRVMGKAAFAHVQDRSGRIQLYIRRDDLPEGVYKQFKDWDLGDIVAARGKVFKTKTGELSVHVQELQLLVKSLRPLPEKFHGLSDQETRYRQRYLDLIMNNDSRRVFDVRSRVLDHIRQFLRERDFVEVETPMMHPIPGGATARPFITHHNSLDMDLYLRIAPELYLKRLVVGGLERVFEINRSFRNEGLSPRHNPEFTMLEFYQAYADYRDLMEHTETLLTGLVEAIFDTTTIEYQGTCIDMAAPYQRLTVREAVKQYNEGVTDADFASLESARALAERLGLKIEGDPGIGAIEFEIFEETVEGKLEQPTFITEFPIEVSPLARRSDSNPAVTDRFELFVTGRELANGFSELNDPEDQAARFREQAERKQAGDAEAMHFDADYITALEHGLPPTAGEGIGIDRLVMLLTDSATIRDVILFPQLRQRQDD